jgi:formylglycine-generating enzyme required for sulfatase activity
MVLFGGAAFEFGIEGRQGLARRRGVTVEDFYLDRAEVSNSEYDKFVRDTGHPLPGYWREWVAAKPGTTQNFDPLWADLPVVDVSWRDAEAYARWSGKRLPTVFEWERAMGDAGRRAQPWGEGPPPESAATESEDMQRAAQTDREQQLRLYLRHVKPVRSSPGLASPEGVFHGASNVQEVVETVSTEPVAVRLIKGAGWAQLPQVWTVRELWTLPFETVVNGRRVEGSSMLGGFRCARSVRPASLNLKPSKGD